MYGDAIIKQVFCFFPATPGARKGDLVTEQNRKCVRSELIYRGAACMMAVVLTWTGGLTMLEITSGLTEEQSSLQLPGDNCAAEIRSLKCAWLCLLSSTSRTWPRYRRQTRTTVCPGKCCDIHVHNCEAMGATPVPCSGVAAESWGSDDWVPGFFNISNWHNFV